MRHATTRVVHLSFATLLIMREFVTTDEPLCGATIARAVKLPTGTVYPVIRRLQKTSWIEFVETLSPDNEPTSHYYRRTRLGHEGFLGALERLAIPRHRWQLSEPV